MEQSRKRRHSILLDIEESLKTHGTTSHTNSSKIIRIDMNRAMEINKGKDTTHLLDSSEISKRLCLGQHHSVNISMNDNLIGQGSSRDVESSKRDSLNQRLGFVSERPNGLVRVGSRKSQLAMIQTTNIVNDLKSRNPSLNFEVETMDTLGDKILSVALPKIGEKSLFTKDLEIALAQRRVDFLVHSLKDLPTTLPVDMALGAIYKRDNPLDAVIFHPKHKNKKLCDLSPGCVIGTSSLRRVSQLKRRYPHLEFESVRGNLNTRLRKLEEDSKYDALILAAAGIDRMGWSDKIGQFLEEEDCLYAVGQGAMAVEIRHGDDNLTQLIGALTDLKTLLCCVAERAFMRVLEGGCSVPIGCYSRLENEVLTVRGAVFSLDGSTCLDEVVSCPISIPAEDLTNDGTSTHRGRHYVISDSHVVVDERYIRELYDAEELGSRLATQLRDRGADRVLAEARAQLPKGINIQIPTKETITISK